MNHRSTSFRKQDDAWYVFVPKQQEFTKPKFHFGEWVQWRGDEFQHSKHCLTGRIIGIQFVPLKQEWQYQILVNESITSLRKECDRADVVKVDVIEHNLTLVQDVALVQPRLNAESDWLLSARAATQLGISVEQLRKLRRRGLFKVGYHCRDTSVPGSGLPRWQWHVARCEKALEIPPSKRSNQ